MDNFPQPDNTYLYRCDTCGEIVRRDQDTGQIESYCTKSEKDSLLIRIQETG